MPFLGARWTLPGSSSRYLITWWYDELAKDTSRHISPFSVISHLDGWLVSRRMILQEIYEALDPNSLSGSLGVNRERRSDQIKSRLAEAFRAGRLVALEVAAENTTHPSETKSPPQGKPSLGLMPPQTSAAQQQKPSPAVMKTFEIRSSAGPTVKVGTKIQYSLHQLQPLSDSAGKKYQFLWSVQTSTSAAAPKGVAIIQGPRDTWTWELYATQAGVHRIKVEVLLNDSLLEELVFEQTVS